jgi:hypothetical protein
MMDEDRSPEQPSTAAFGNRWATQPRSPSRDEQRTGEPTILEVLDVVVDAGDALGNRRQFGVRAGILGVGDGRLLLRAAFAAPGEPAQPVTATSTPVSAGPMTPRTCSSS